MPFLKKMPTTFSNNGEIRFSLTIPRDKEGIEQYDKEHHTDILGVMKLVELSKNGTKAVSKELTNKRYGTLTLSAFNDNMKIKRPQPAIKLAHNAPEQSTGNLSASKGNTTFLNNQTNSNCKPCNSIFLVCSILTLYLCTSKKEYCLLDEHRRWKHLG